MHFIIEIYMTKIVIYSIRPELDRMLPSGGLRGEHGSRTLAVNIGILSVTILFLSFTIC